MFFPERIHSIQSGDKVLEVGPGSQPYLRADVYLDRWFDDEMSVRQNGGSPSPSSISEKTVFYDGGRFPFEDNAFDYVVCSHVIEHVPAAELDLFIQELHRVAKKGYLEYPRAYYEMFLQSDTHLWYMNNDDDGVILMDKKLHVVSNIEKCLGSMFYAGDMYCFNAYARYKEFFFFGFEWSDTIRYRTVDSFDALVSVEDLQQWQAYFARQQRDIYTEKVVNALKRIRGGALKLVSWLPGRGH